MVGTKSGGKKREEKLNYAAETGDDGSRGNLKEGIRKGATRLFFWEDGRNGLGFCESGMFYYITRIP